MIILRRPHFAEKVARLLGQFPPLLGQGGEPFAGEVSETQLLYA